MQTFENYDFSGKKALIRVDFNVPLNDKFEITDDTRIQKALPTIKKILGNGGAVILMSHLGRPKGGPDEKFSLKHVVPHLSRVLGVEVQFASDCIGEEANEKKKNLKPGDVLLLENLRFHDEEKKGDAGFASQLAENVDVYVNDAFGTAHRAHASTAIIADNFKENKLFGYLIENEVNSLEKVLKEPQRPFTAIMGGAKVSDKILVLENLIDKVDNLIIGGGMTYTFIKAQGGKIGKSLCEEDKLELARDILKKAKDHDVNIYLPVDSVNADDFKNDANSGVSKIDEVPDNMMGLDIGDETIKLFGEVIKNSKTILWNGPMGVFEMENFARGTKAIAEAIAGATSTGTFSLVGGGDSVAAINKMNLSGKVSYVSTGGGAMLEYLEGKVLPGVKAIKG